MKDEDKYKAIKMEAGLKALSSPPPETEKNSYSGNPLPGSVVVPCKNQNCRSAIESGIVYNTEEWIAGFIAEERECPDCKSKAVYSRDDVEVEPLSQ
jgi:hypothetical protein